MTAAAADAPPTAANLLDILSHPETSSSTPTSSSLLFPSSLAQLKAWNDHLESTNFAFLAHHPSSANEEQAGEDGTEHVCSAATALSDRLVEIVSANSSALAPCSAGGDDDGIGRPKLSWAEAESDRGAEATQAARSIISSSCLSDTTNNNETQSILLQISELLRSAKNLIRYHGMMRQRNDGMGRFPSNGICNDNIRNPLCSLRRCEMLRLYVTILVGCCLTPIDSVDDEKETRGRRDYGRMRDDAARNASLALFHATYGPADSHPEATAARKLLLLSDSRGVDFVPALMWLLTKAGGEDGTADELTFPSALMLSLARHVHSLVACESAAAVPLMEDSLRMLHQSKSLVLVLVNVLSCVVNSSNPQPFPGTEASDRRPEVATEILRVLFALRVTGLVPLPSDNRSEEDGGEEGDDNANSSGAANSVDSDTMTRIGELLCQLLKLPATDSTSTGLDDRRLVPQLSVIHLLMDAPKGYGRCLLNEGALPALLRLFRHQIDEVVERRTGSFNADAAALVPILAVLDRFSGDDADVLRAVKEEIFPISEEEAYQARAAEERAKGGGGRRGLGAKNMKPALDHPPGTLRWKMVKLMTWPESNVKRCASELLWRVCGGDATEFVLRTGFGNAVHMLGIKGLVQIPKG